MAINFALERKRFREEQERLRRKYEALGMTKEQIREMYEFDLYQFNRDIAYSRHTQQLMPDTELEAEGKNPLLHKFEDELTVTQEPDKTRQLWWLDEIEDEALLESLLQLSEEDLRSRKSRRFLKTIIIVIAAVCLLLFGYVVYTLYLLMN